MEPGNNVKYTLWCWFCEQRRGIAEIKANKWARLILRTSFSQRSEWRRHIVICMADKKLHEYTLLKSHVGNLCSYVEGGHVSIPLSPWSEAELMVVIQGLITSWCFYRMEMHHMWCEQLHFKLKVNWEQLPDNADSECLFLLQGWL